MYKLKLLEINLSGRVAQDVAYVTAGREKVDIIIAGEIRMEAGRVCENTVGNNGYVLALHIT